MRPTFEELSETPYKSNWRDGASIGTLALITPETVLNALREAKTGRVIPLK
jgi:hypothetical protein